MRNFKDSKVRAHRRSKNKIKVLSGRDTCGKRRSANFSYFPLLYFMALSTISHKPSKIVLNYYFLSWECKNDRTCNICRGSVSYYRLVLLFHLNDLPIFFIS